MKHRPFTLIELMIGLIISGILLASLLGVFSQVISLRDKQETVREERLLKQRCLNTLQRDLANLAIPGGSFVTPFAVEIHDNGDTHLDILTYVTATNPQGDEAQQGGELLRIELRVDADETDSSKKVLVRSAQANINAQEVETPPDVILLRDVTSLTCRTYASSAWQNGWTPTNTNDVPMAIELEIIAAGQTYRLVVAPWAGTVSSTTSTTTTGS